MIHFNAELCNIHQLFVLHVLYEKRKNSSKKSRKIGQGSKLCHDIVSALKDDVPFKLDKACNILSIGARILQS